MGSRCLVLNMQAFPLVVMAVTQVLAGYVVNRFVLKMTAKFQTFCVKYHTALT